MAKNAGLQWDLILSAELAKHYKPDREAYMTAVDLLSLKPGEVMMAAAHSGDLRAAASFGLRTGFIYRPNERGPGGKADHARPGEFDVVSNGYRGPGNPNGSMKPGLLLNAIGLFDADVQHPRSGYGWVSSSRKIMRIPQAMDPISNMPS